MSMHTRGNDSANTSPPPVGSINGVVAVGRDDVDEAAARYLKAFRGSSANADSAFERDVVDVRAAAGYGASRG